MPPTDVVTVQDIHYATISPLADAIGKLMWPVPITWFHDFGLTHVGARRDLLRIGLSELRAGNPPVYASLRVTLFASGGAEITTQDFPFNYYDSGRKSAAKELSLTDVKGIYSFVSLIRRICGLSSALAALLAGEIALFRARRRCGFRMHVSCRPWLCC